MTTKILDFFFAIAIPAAIPKPCPSDPVEASIPLVNTSG